MNKKEFNTRIVQKTGRSEREVAKLLKSLAVVMGETLCGNYEISLPGLGTFVAEVDDEKIVTDETDGKRYLYPPCNNVVFAPAQSLLSKLKDKG